MGMTINGAGSMNHVPAMMGALSIKDKGAAGDGNYRVGKKTGPARLKKLNYNHREISGQILGAKKAQSASVVLSRAKSKLSVLQQSAASGQYDTKEVSNALAHARRMIRCAQLKVRNLKEEESENKNQSRESDSQAQQKNAEVKRRTAAKERQLKQKLEAEQIQNVQRERAKCAQMVKKQKLHRMEEQGKVNEADMKYIKGELNNMSSGGTGALQPDSGVILELSAEAAVLNDAQIRLLAEREAEQAVSMEGVSCDSGSGIVSPDMSMSAGTADIPAETVASAAPVDVTV